MAAITIPSFGGDDLYLYMREIVEEEFPKALRQACKPLWDEKHALRYRLWDHSCHLCNSNSVVSESLEKLDFYDLCHIMTHSRLPGLANYTEQNAILRRRRNRLFHNRRWHVKSAIGELRDLKEQYVDIKGSICPQLLRQQLAQARGAFISLGVTLNDSRNAIDFSAAGLQDLIPGKYVYYSALSLNCYSACMNINFCNVTKVKRAP